MVIRNIFHQVWCIGITCFAKYLSGRVHAIQQNVRWPFVCYVNCRSDDGGNPPLNKFIVNKVMRRFANLCVALWLFYAKREAWNNSLLC